MIGRLLDAVKVVEYGNFIAAPYCAKLMADLGAEVIKVEEPHVGDEARHYGPFPGDVPHPERSGLFLFLNTNKLGITLNVKTGTGKKILRDLLRGADIFVENNPAKTMRRVGFDWRSLKKINPRLIMVSITPFGQTGPYRDYKAYAINCSAGGGFSIGFGEPNREPLRMPLSLDNINSGVVGAIGGLAALIARSKTGRGQHVDVSEMESWISLLTGVSVFAYIVYGLRKGRMGHRQPGPYPRTTLPCKDGYISMLALQGYQWRRFLEIVGGGKIPDWYANDPRFKDRLVAGRDYADQLDSLLSPWLMAHTRDEIFRICLGADVPFAPVRYMDEVLNDAHLEERNFFVKVDHPETGMLKYPGAPYIFSKTPWKIECHAPLLGEHNEKIFCKRLGYSKEDLVQFRRGGII